MNSNWLKQLAGFKTDGDGIRRDIPLSLRDFYLNSDGSTLTTTLTTNPGFAVASNGQVLKWNAAIVTVPGISVFLPGDYDETADDLRVRVLAGMSGATDTPTLTLAGYRERTGGAPTAITSKTGIVPFGEAGAGAARTVASTIKWIEFNLGSQSLKANDALYLNLTPGAHGTDTLQVYSVVARFKSVVALLTLADR